MDRVLVLGRGGAGKTVLSRALGAKIGAEVIELDSAFWDGDLVPLPKEQWADRQRALARRDRWVMDGDLGPYDYLEPRLLRADTVVMLDLPLLLCAWRALRRGHERRDFWVWMLRWRRDSRPRLLSAVRVLAPDAEFVVLTSRRGVRGWVSSLER